jgi:hypothetical protein
MLKINIRKFAVIKFEKKHKTIKTKQREAFEEIRRKKAQAD